MKKIILTLFLFFFIICTICYYIYNITESNNQYILSIGDNISNNYYLTTNNRFKYNTTFVNKDYRIIDLLNIIKYNEEMQENNKSISIHQLLKKTDILIISIGMNDIYYKLNDNKKEIYTYLNDIINNYKLLLKEINKYNFKKVYVLGYYNINNNNNDLFTYTNYKLNLLAKSYNYTFIDLDKIINKNLNYLEKNNNFTLNNSGYYQIYQILVENLKKS